MRDDKDLSFDEMIAKTRASLLDALLPDVVFDGWSEGLLESATQKTGIDQANLKLAFPRGIKDVVTYFHRSGDAHLTEIAPKVLAQHHGITSKVEALIMARFEIAAREKDAVRKAASYLALPMNIGTGPLLIWETCDLIWKLVGVTDKGFSHYSRRASLASIYSSTFLFWLQDDQHDMTPTREFLSRRLGDLGNFHQMKAKITKPFERQS